jgi:hypothetical protein
MAIGLITPGFILYSRKIVKSGSWLNAATLNHASLNIQKESVHGKSIGDTLPNTNEMRLCRN